MNAENKEDVFCLDIDSAMKHCPIPEGTKKYTFEILYPNKDGSLGSWGTDAKDIQHGFGVSFEDMLTTSHKRLVAEDMSRVKLIEESLATSLEYAEHIVAVDKCRLGYKELLHK
jgi:hypothetical protein